MLRTVVILHSVQNTLASPLHRNHLRQLSLFVCGIQSVETRRTLQCSAKNGTSIQVHVAGSPAKLFCGSSCVGRRFASSYSGINFGLVFKRDSSSSASSALHKVFYVEAAPPDNVMIEAAVSENAASVEVLADVNNAAATPVDQLIEYIPPPPIPPPDVVTDIPLNALGEPTFSSIGLCNWTPVGLVQWCLETLHVTFGLPWWGSIAVLTIIMRFLIFPLVVISQRNAAKLNNIMPQMQVLQLKMNEAKKSGNHLLYATYAHELQKYMKDHGVNPIRSMVVPLAQAPVFISMFIGLRKCANLPVESFKDGGMLWFADLTVADPYYILPLITSATLMATIELGTEGVKVTTMNANLMKYVLRALPVIIFPFCMNFPAAVLVYWTSTNFFSLLQVGFLKIPVVRQYFKIDPLIRHSPESLPQSKKGFVQGFRDSWDNIKLAKEIDERQRIDEIRFRKAGMGPLVRTYKHNPLDRKNIIDVKAKPK